jgi:hypothetical protein
VAITNRQQIIENVRHFWIDGVLENSLHGAVLMQLGLSAQSNFSHRPWIVNVRHNGEDHSLEQHTRIVDVFDQSAGTLLILGEPGSGKTTLLLELTRDLLDQSEAQADSRIPIVFNLSSWAKDKLGLEAWLVDELNIKYQVARSVAENMVAERSLSLLLDGLDEVAESVRNDCVNEINTYHRQYPDVPMVVCSRTGDYDALSAKLDFHDAFMIEPLDDMQVDTYLASFGESMTGLRQQMESDRRLRALAETPLTLSIMTLAYQGVDITTLPDDVSLDVQRKHLFDTYINTMFERHGNSTDHKPEEVTQYLSWLAGRIVERRQTLFHIENLQWDWLETRLQQSSFKLLGRTAYGTLIGGLAGAAAMTVVMILIAVVLGQDVEFNRYPADTVYGFSALGVYAIVGALSGMLMGGIPFGLTGLIAFTGDRLSIKGQARGYRARTAVTSILIGLFSSMIGGLVFLLLIATMNGGNITMYSRHFYEIGANRHHMEGVEAMWLFMQVSLLMGLVGGIVSVGIAGWWHRREGRVRQIINGVAGLLIGGGFMLGFWLIFESRGYSDPSHLLFPILVVSLFTGGIGILTGGLTDRIESVESIVWRWNWRWAKVGLAVPVVIVGLDYLSSPRWYSGSNGIAHFITLFLPIATLCVLVGGVAAGLRKNEKVESRIQPNQGIRQSAKTALKITGAFSIVGFIIAVISMSVFLGTEFINNEFVLTSLSEWEFERIVERFRTATILGISVGLVAGLILGGTDTVIKHLVLRLMLWRNGDIPMNLAKTLDHASSLILMRKVGGGYIFVHRYLLEHFAILENE